MINGKKIGYFLGQVIANCLIGAGVIASITILAFTVKLLISVFN